MYGEHEGGGMSAETRNMNITAKHLVLGSPEWQAERRTGIGASEVGAVLGVCPWKSPVDVWLEKTGRQPPFEGNKATHWGQLLEDLVAHEYAKQVGMKVRRHNFTLRRGLLLGDLDRLVHADGEMPAVSGLIRAKRAMDAKTTKDRSLWADGLPMSYEAQGLSYMALAPSIELFDFACLFLAERDLEVFPLVRDDAAIAEILERIEAWWARHIVGQTAPDPMSEADCKKLWGRHRPTTVCFATPEVESALVALAQAKAAKAEAEAAEAEAKRTVMALMQENESLKSADGSKVLATWKSNKDSEVVDWEAIARELSASPELFAAVVKAKTTVKPGARVLLVKE